MAANRGNDGFTLAELLAALAVAALVIPAVLAVIPRAFSSLAASKTTADGAIAVASFDAAFDRDFSSLVRECGFSGDGSACSFWTLRPTGPEEFAPSLVEYRRTRGGVARLEFSLALYAELAGTNIVAVPPDTSGTAPSQRPTLELFRVAISPFRYGAADSGADVEASEWNCATNAPVAIATALAEPDGADAAIPRLYFRRTPQ